MTDTKKDLSADLERVQTELDAATTEVERLRDAMLSIKGLVVGDKHPNWISDFTITQTRSHIADLCDVALRQTS